MSLVLGQLLGANNEAALAVFQALRRSSAQREAISEAARVSLNQADNELLAAILNVHKSIEAERNALAHGHFGMCSALPNSLLWMSTSDYLALTQPAIRALPTMPVPGPKWEWSEAQAKNALASMWVYKSKDIKAIFKEIMEVSGLWFDFPIFGNTSSRATLKNGLKDTPDYVVNRVLPKS